MMRRATRYDDADRRRLGLLSLATQQDLARSLETSGEATDQYKVTASKIFNVPYAAVTDQMRRAAKTASFYSVYR